MKRTLQLMAPIAYLFAACTHAEPPKVQPVKHPRNTAMAKTVAVGTLPNRADSFSKFIPLDSANKMLQSYLASINYLQNDTELHSIIFKAADLRQMLADPKTSNVKIMFAHTLDYINAGGSGEYCGYKSKELTVIISSYDSAGNYTYTPAGKVLEMGAPCPTSCPKMGNASNDLLY